MQQSASPPATAGEPADLEKNTIREQAMLYPSRQFHPAGRVAL
jgi:hypothetical protein